MFSWSNSENNIVEKYIHHLERVIGGMSDHNVTEKERLVTIFQSLIAYQDKPSNESLYNVYDEIVKSELKVGLVARIAQYLIKRLRRWEHVYAADEGKGSVWNESIGKWQAEMMQLSSEEAKAYVDFMRDFKINNVSCRSENQVSDEIGKLIASASEKVYDIAAKVKLTQWIIANGGQDNNRFIELMALAKEFGEEYAFGESKGESLHWYVAKDGRVTLQMTINYYTLIDANSTIIMKNKLGHDVVYKNINEDCEKILKDFNYKEHPPLFKMRANISLDVRKSDSELVVVPTISYLKVAADTMYLRPPKIDETVRNSLSLT